MELFFIVIIKHLSLSNHVRLLAYVFANCHQYCVLVKICLFSYQAQLQKNLMYLAAIADAQPQAPTMPPQVGKEFEGSFVNSSTLKLFTHFCI